MIPNRGEPRRFSRPGLALRLIFVLSIAILPLGLISVYQTKKVIEDRRTLSGAALQDATQQAATASRDLFGAASGAAETLSLMLPLLRNSDTDCDAVMRQMVERNPSIVFAGYTDTQFDLVCSSRDRDESLLGAFETLSETLQPGAPGIFLRSLEFLGGVVTVNVTVPVISEDRALGTIWVALPLSALQTALTSAAPNADLVLFQADGQVLATEEFNDSRRAVLPEDWTLPNLAAGGRQVFRGVSREGLDRDFVVAPVFDGEVFVLGSWEPRHEGLVTPAYAEAIALYFPIAMWVIATLVASIGLHRLVIRHVRRLRSWLRLYAGGHSNFIHARLDNAPQELEELAEAFRAMTGRLTDQDRAREEDLQEKTVLLREVHHRVKNNLQLISSMMNMQIRTTHSQEAKNLLRRVQDRVMALSAVHRYLYMARKLSLVRIDKLLEDIIQQLVIVGTMQEAGYRISVSTELDPIEINPDQSVPVSLLAAEAAINAVKYCGNSEGETPWINIALKESNGDTVCLSVVNSLAPPNADGTVPQDTLSKAGTGLGSRLIESFALQLNGSIDVVENKDRYELHVTFPRAWHDEEANGET